MDAIDEGCKIYGHDWEMIPVLSNKDTLFIEECFWCGVEREDD